MGNAFNICPLSGFRELCLFSRLQPVIYAEYASRTFPPVAGSCITQEIHYENSPLLIDEWNIGGHFSHVAAASLSIRRLCHK